MLSNGLSRMGTGVLSRLVKVTLKDGMAARLSALAQRDELAEAEVVRRALADYFERHAAQGQDWAMVGPGLGQDRAKVGPGSAQEWAKSGPGSGQDRAGQENPSFSPPSSLPLHSLSA